MKWYWIALVVVAVGATVWVVYHMANKSAATAPATTTK